MNLSRDFGIASVLAPPVEWTRGGYLVAGRDFHFIDDVTGHPVYLTAESAIAAAERDGRCFGFVERNLKLLTGIAGRRAEPPPA